jgi:hypothetical protein
MNLHNEGWSSLNHGGLLISAGKLSEYFPETLPDLNYLQAEQLRRAVTAFDGTNSGLAPLLDYVLQDLSGLPGDEWQKAQAVESRWSLRSFTGVNVKPRRIWQGPNGETLPVFVPEEGASRQFSGRLGVGRSRQLLSRVTEWLRRQKQPMALVTNGRQWRLIHAGPDYESWCEWDIELWFQEGEPAAQTLAWRALINRDVLLSPDGQSSLLMKAVSESRKGQAELSSILGERVRQAVEQLITASQATIEQSQGGQHRLDYNDLYVAGSRIVMRCIITLFAEARGLLPVDNPVYQQAYSLEGLRQQLDRRSGGRGSDRLSHGRSAWPRLIGLFNLIYHGSAHQAIPVPHYGGALFEPGNAESEDPITRALAILESPDNLISDQQVLNMLRLLTRTRLKIRQGRRNTWVDGPVDFSALSSEYIGILYEGLLDFELKQAAADDPVIFLGVGNQPALALSQLEAMDDKTIKQLFEALKKKEKSGADEGEEEDSPVDADEELEDEGSDDADGDAEETLEEDEVPVEDEQVEPALTEDHLTRAQDWLEKAAVMAGLVKKPRGRAASQGIDPDELRKAAKQLCAKMIAPGQFYLVRWGGTRKGAGTFYTRPQLAAPTVRRTLQPLTYDGLQTAIDSRTGLEEVTQWAPKNPEQILSLKVCDPAMGSGSFLVGALRYLTDALVESLFHHEYIRPAGETDEATLDKEKISSLLSDELLKLKPGHEGFEEALRAQLKRHIVERCLYGVDLDPLAVELGRMALWVETMDRDLPFGFLDHKLKVGNALVGAWFDTYREYPAMAWQREGGDKDYQKNNPGNLINHYYVKTHTTGKKKGQQETKGDVFNDTIKERSKAVPDQLIAIISGQADMDEKLPAADVHDELFKVFRKLHRLPVYESEKRAELYRDKILNNPHYHELKARMDLWCALWFWPGESIELAPLPQEFRAPAIEALEIAKQVSQQNHFFHWELEYPDVFTANQSGFDAVLGNPPWEIHKPNSKEFFSNHDPLYRAYGKQEALAKQLEYFHSAAELEHRWIQYNASFKAMSNWAKYVGQPFGDRVTEDSKGKKKHDLALGGGGRNSFANSEEIHKRWLKRRKKHKGFADAAHPFLHQGSADLNTYKMFLEQSHAILGQAGRMGMIVPSGLYTDKGTTDLRALFLEQCDWQWLFGFENREGIFDIHRSFKFCPLIVEKGGETKAIRAAFMHRNVDDWEHAERFVLAYPRDRVIEFSPYSKSILEIRSNKDLEVLKKIYANGVLLGDQSEEGWGIKYATEFHMTNDSRLFPERPKWEAKGYQPDEYGHWLKGAWRDYSGPQDILEREPGLVLSRDRSQVIKISAIENRALPVYNAKNFDLWDFCSAGWLSGKGRGAKWESINFPKVVKPEYLMSFNEYIESAKVLGAPKLLFKDISTSIHKRTMMSALVPDFPAVNASPVLACRNRDDDVLLQTILGSFVFDYVAKFKIGYLHLNYFIIEECPLVRRENMANTKKFLTELAVRLSAISEIFSDLWHRSHLNANLSWRRQWALTQHERLRIRVIVDAIMAYLNDISCDEFSWLLKDCDLPLASVSKKSFTNKLDQKRFWRIDKKREPELRHTVLAQVAYYDLIEKGLEFFISQNDCEGWLIPETLRLADYGLGHDDRSRDHQPVASRLGPRFYDWQLNEDVERSWEECAAHAELIRQIVPLPEDNDEVAEPAAEYAEENPQGALF